MDRGNSVRVMPVVNGKTHLFRKTRARGENLTELTELRSLQSILDRINKIYMIFDKGIQVKK
jgi:hypothetical protein